MNNISDMPKTEEKEKLNIFLGDFYCKMLEIPTNIELARVFLSEFVKDKSTVTMLDDESSAESTKDDQSKVYINNKESLADVTQTYLDKMIGSRVNIIEEITNLYDGVVKENTDIMKKIIGESLFECIFSTSFDTYIESSDEYSRDLYKILPYRKSENKNLNYNNCEDKIRYYKLLGDISNINEMIITSQDIRKSRRLTFYKEFWSRVRSELSSRSTVYLGVDLHDPDFIDMIEYLYGGISNYKKKIYFVIPPDLLSANHIFNGRIIEFIKKYDVKLISTAESDFLDDLKANVVNDENYKKKIEMIQDDNGNYFVKDYDKKCTVYNVECTNENFKADEVAGDNVISEPVQFIVDNSNIPESAIEINNDIKNEKIYSNIIKNEENIAIAEPKDETVAVQIIENNLENTVENVTEAKNTEVNNDIQAESKNYLTDLQSKVEQEEPIKDVKEEINNEESKEENKEENKEEEEVEAKAEEIKTEEIKTEEAKIEETIEEVKKELKEEEANKAEEIKAEEINDEVKAENIDENIDVDAKADDIEKEKEIKESASIKEIEEKIEKDSVDEDNSYEEKDNIDFDELLRLAKNDAKNKEPEEENKASDTITEDSKLSFYPRLGIGEKIINIEQFRRERYVGKDLFDNIGNITVGDGTGQTSESSHLPQVHMISTEGYNIDTGLDKKYCSIGLRNFPIKNGNILDEINFLSIENIGIADVIIGDITVSSASIKMYICTNYNVVEIKTREFSMCLNVSTNDEKLLTMNGDSYSYKIYSNLKNSRLEAVAVALREFFSGKPIMFNCKGYTGTICYGNDSEVQKFNILLDSIKDYEVVTSQLKLSKEKNISEMDNSFYTLFLLSSYLHGNRELLSWVTFEIPNLYGIRSGDYIVFEKKHNLKFKGIDFDLKEIIKLKDPLTEDELANGNISCKFKKVGITIATLAKAESLEMLKS